jgi:hypothetical protein
MSEDLHYSDSPTRPGDISRNQALELARKAIDTLNVHDTGAYRREVMTEIKVVSIQQQHGNELLRLHMLDDKERFNGQSDDIKKLKARQEKFEAWINRVAGAIGSISFVVMVLKYMGVIK